MHSGRKDEAKSLLERMIDDPGSDDEHHFAADFYARKFNGQRTGACTELLRKSREVVIDEVHRGNPEAGAAIVLRREQYRVHFTENMLWHNLFGLLFWEELFESGQLHSGFDWVPHCLKDRSFARIFEHQIAVKLAATRERRALPLILKHGCSPLGQAEWHLQLAPNRHRGFEEPACLRKCGRCCDHRWSHDARLQSDARRIS